MSIFKKERFSIRKFSIGAASVLIGASLFAGNVASAADENGKSKNVEVHYVAEGDLTAEEKAALKEFSDNQKVSEDVEAYYYVYRPNAKTKNILPNTMTTPLKGIAIAGTTLIVVALFVAKRRKKILMASAFAVGLSGILGSAALANEDFKRFFENVDVTIGGNLPTPKNIEGYTFTGYYFTKNVQNEVNPSETIVPNEPTTPDKPSDDNNKPVTPDKPSDDNNKPVTPDKPADNKGVNTLDPTDEKLNGTAENPEVKVRENTKTTEIPFETVTEEDSNLEKGKTVVKQEGKNGEKIETTREFYIVENGEEKVVYTDVVSTKETAATNKIIVVGTKEASVTPDKPSDDNNKPVTPDKPSDDNNKPVTPDKPSDDNNKPVTPDKPSDDNNKPVTPDKPSDDNNKPVTPDKPSDDNNKPVTPDKPSDDNNKPVTPDKPSDDNNKPVTPDKPADNKGVNTLDPTDEKENGTAENPEVKVRENAKTTEIPFETVTEEDSNLEKGKTVVKQEGKNGEKVETTREFYIVENGAEKVVYTDVVSTKETAATNKIIVVGTKESSKGAANVEPALPEATVKTVTIKEETIPFDTIYKADENLEKGKTSVITEGQNGSFKVVRDDIYEGDKLVDTGAEKEVDKIDKVDKVVLVGTKATVETKETDFKTEYRENKTLDYGQTIVENAGKNGGITTKTTYKIENGEAVVDKVEVSSTEAENRIVIVGTKETMETKEVAYGTDYVADDSIAYGSIEEVAGKAGTKTITTTYKLQGDKAVVDSTSEEITEKPTNKVVKVGTKQKIDVVTSPIEEKYVEDVTAEVNTSRTVKQGTAKVTATITTYTLDATTGKVTSSEKTEVTEGTATEIAIGTKPTIEKRDVDFKTVYESDPEAQANTKTTKTEGEKGVGTTTTTYKLQGDKAVVDKTTTEITKAPIDEVIKVGTKEKVETKELDYVTEYQADPQETANKQTVIVAGKAGKAVTTTTYTLNTETGIATENEPTIETTKPTNKVVKVGTKPTVETVETKYKTVYEADSSLAYGQKSEPTQGTNGKTVTTTNYTLNTETGIATAKTPIVETTQPINSVIKVGNVKVETKTIAKMTEYKGDDKVEYSKQEVETEGRDGEEVTTTTYQVDAQGNLVNPAIETKTTAAQNKVIKVGNVKVETTSIAITERTEDDPSLPEGETKVISNGKEGKETTTTTYAVNKETGALENITSTNTVETEKMEQKVIARGTKKATVVDKSALEKLVQEVAALNADDYTDASYKNLAEPKAAAQEVLSNQAATQEQVTNALNALQQAKDALVKFVPLEKPTLTVEKVATDDDANKATLTYKVTDSQNAFVSAKVELIKNGKVVKEVYLPKDGATVDLSDLESDITYTLKTTLTYTNGRKETSEQVDSRDIIISKKQIDFSDVTKRELYVVKDDGKMEVVTGLIAAPTDVSKYIMKLTRQNHKEVLLPVSSITEKSSGYEVIYNGVQYKDPEKMTISKAKTYEGAYTQFDKLLAAMKANTLSSKSIKRH